MNIFIYFDLNYLEPEVHFLFQKIWDVKTLPKRKRKHYIANLIKSLLKGMGLYQAIAMQSLF